MLVYPRSRHGQHAASHSKEQKSSRLAAKRRWTKPYKAALGIDGAEFYSIVVDDSREDVEKFFADNGGDWPVVLDHQLIDVAFGVALVPETWIIDPSGIVEARIISRVSTERLNITMQQLREVYTG